MYAAALTRHSVNFRQAVYELFGIGKDLSNFVTEEDRAFEEWYRGRDNVFNRWIHRLNDKASTAHFTVQIYAQIMPELRVVVAE